MYTSIIHCDESELAHLIHTRPDGPALPGWYVAMGRDWTPSESNRLPDDVAGPFDTRAEAEAFIVESAAA